jgi:hypothetical protein
MAGPSLYPILLNRGATQPPDLYPLFMERDDLVPLRTRVGLVFEPVIIDRICEFPIAEPEIDRPAAAEIVQDHSVVTFSPQSREAEIRAPVRIKMFDLGSEPQPEDRVVSEGASERTSERAVFKVKTRKRSYTV